MLSLFISPVVIFAFTTGEVFEDIFFLDLSSTGTRRLRKFYKTFRKIGRKATDHREPSSFVNTIIAGKPYCSHLALVVYYFFCYHY